MKQYQYKSREEYLDAQVVRSRNKFPMCKVYFADVARYEQLLRNYQRVSIAGPILCLGVRSGAEVDMFRALFYSPLMQSSGIRNWVATQDQSTDGQAKIRLARRFGIGAGSPDDNRVWGVEVNPDAARPDIHIGSFDDLPAEWQSRFQILYSNSFDHSIDPQRTMKEWRRVAAPGAYIIIAFTPNTTPSHTDPLGGLTISSMIDLWQLPVVFATETMGRGGYHEVCFQLSDG